VPTTLPQPIEELFNAANSFNLDDFMKPFADDALVNDAHRQYWGKNAIRRWSSIEIVGDRATFHACDVIDHHGEVIVMAEIDGDYDKEGLPVPYIMSLFFTLRGDKIVRLIVLPINGRKLGKMTPTRQASTCFSAPVPTV
jgi:hypothetical protein